MRYLLLLLALAITGPVHAEPSVFVFNQSKHTAVINQNTDQVRPIASITKLMTALIAIESGLSLESRAQLINRWSTVLPKRSYTRLELLTAMLVRSDNSAAESLAQDYPGGRTAFIGAMNAKATQLGMTHTHFDDASGLSKLNVSTARDLIILLTDAYKHDKIREISALSRYDLKVVDKKNKEKSIPVNNTNVKLMNKFDIIEVSKTGTTNAAGKCLVMIVHKNGDQYAIVILGGTTRADVDNLAKNIMEKVI